MGAGEPPDLGEAGGPAGFESGEGGAGEGGWGAWSGGGVAHAGLEEAVGFFEAGGVEAEDVGVGAGEDEPWVEE